MILMGNAAVEKIRQVVSQARSFCYILAPWIGASIARKIKDAIYLPDTIIVVRDYFEGNFKTYRLLKDYDFRVDSKCHIKLIITEKSYCAGSQNWTNKGLFVDHGAVTYHTRDSEDYASLLRSAMDVIMSAKPFDENHELIYWNNKNRPLKTMPPLLVAPDAPEYNPKEEAGESEQISTDIEPIELPPPSEESKTNLSAAWRLLLRKGEKNS